MKTFNKLQTVTIAILIIASIPAAKAQRAFILTKKGKVIKNVKIKNAKNGMDEVVYRKNFHRKKISREKVLYIQFDNGEKTVINPVTTAKNYKNYSQPATNSKKSNTPTDSLKNKANSMAQKTNVKKHHIERIGKSFRIDTTQIINTHKINKIMAQSGNPMIAAPLKAAKTMRMFHTIIKISSFPSSAGGAWASFNTFKSLFQQLKNGPASFKYYLNAGLSFVGTLSLPITSKILSHIQDKLYDKTLQMYSAGN